MDKLSKTIVERFRIASESYEDWESDNGFTLKQTLEALADDVVSCLRRIEEWDYDEEGVTFDVQALEDLSSSIAQTFKELDFADIPREANHCIAKFRNMGPELSGGDENLWSKGIRRLSQQANILVRLSDPPQTYKYMGQLGEFLKGLDILLDEIHTEYKGSNLLFDLGHSIEQLNVEDIFE